MFFFLQFLGKMEQNNIDPGDLIYLEEDLTREELTSILFLLYGGEKSQWILEKLSQRSENLLNDFATHHTNWKTLVIEALTIVRIFEIVNNLGIKSSEAREHLRKFSITNQGLKLLYQLCETTLQDTTDKLISYIKKHCDSARKCNEKQLEFYLLHAISSQIIKIAPSLDDCDFSFIVNFFNKNKCDEVEALLKEFPKRSNSLDNANNNSFNTILPTLMLPTSSKTPSVTDEYPATKMQVLIINQQSFYRETNPELIHLLPDHDLNDRKGTSKDMEALQLLFEEFYYQVTIKSNQKHTEILTEVEKATKRASLSDGLIVCVLSHGHEGIVYGHNSIPVRIKDIKKVMASKILLGKSKIFLIQACQGENLQKSVKKIIPKHEFDGPSQSTVMSGSVFADFLIFWSTIEGFASVRHIDNGSWFIQELVRKIRELHRDQHLMDICTAVIKEVSLKRGYKDECMLPKLEATFTRNFRFPESKNDSNC